MELHPINTNPEKFHLIAPFEMDFKKWLQMRWIDQYSGKRFRISTDNVCDRQTKGLLYRRHVRIGEIVAIGKESNKLEEVDAGLIHSADSVYVTYPNPARNSWTRDVVPKLQKIPLSVLVRETGLSRRMLIKARRGQAKPHSRNQLLIASAESRINKTNNSAL